MFLDRPWSDVLCGMRELDIRWNEFLLLGDADDRGKIDSYSAIENEYYPPIILPISEEIGAFVLGSSDELPQRWRTLANHGFGRICLEKLSLFWLLSCNKESDRPTRLCKVSRRPDLRARF